MCVCSRACVYVCVVVFGCVYVFFFGWGGRAFYYSVAFFVSSSESISFSPGFFISRLLSLSAKFHIYFLQTFCTFLLISLPIIIFIDPRKILKKKRRKLCRKIVRKRRSNICNYFLAATSLSSNTFRILIRTKKSSLSNHSRRRSSTEVNHTCQKPLHFIRKYIDI